MGRLMRMMVEKGVMKPLSKPFNKKLPDSLFPYQKEGVRLLCEANGRALLADEMGLGKTCQALTYLNINPNIRPALVICPSSLKINWARECFKWLDDEEHNTVYILSGREVKLVEKVTIGKRGQLKFTQVERIPRTGIVIMNYDILANDHEKYIDTEGNKKKREMLFTGWIDELPKKLFKILIPDEAHKVKDRKALRTKAFKKLAKDIPKFIPISGTPILSRPIELQTVLGILDPPQFADYWSFGMRFCNPKGKKGYGLDFKGASNIPTLHKLLKGIMIRRLKADVLPDLPPKISSIVPLDIINRKEYNRADDDLIGYLEEFDTEAALRAKNAVGLVKVNKLKELALKGKIDACIDWIESFIENGEKLVVFTTHDETIERLQKAFKNVSVVVNGKVTGKRRDAAVEQFQNDPETLLFIGNIEAAGVGLTLTASSNVAIIEFPWTPGEVSQAIDRCHRIGTTAECINVYYLVAQGTIEEDIAELIDEKLIIIKQILDGKNVKLGDLLTELLLRVKKGDTK